MKPELLQLIACRLLVGALLLSGCASLPTEHANTVTLLSASSVHNRYDVRRAKRLQTNTHPNCVICGRPPTKLRRNDAHHTLPISHDPLHEHVADVANLETLCRSCHFRWGHAGNWRRYNVNLAECIDSVDHARSQIEKDLP